MSIKKVHVCKKCHRYGDTYRAYIRTRPDKWDKKYHDMKREFQSIGWFCSNCRLFETDEMIEQREKKERIKRKYNLKNDKEYNEFLKKQPIEEKKENIKKRYGLKTDKEYNDFIKTHEIK